MDHTHLVRPPIGRYFFAFFFGDAFFFVEPEAFFVPPFVGPQPDFLPIVEPFSSSETENSPESHRPNSIVSRHIIASDNTESTAISTLDGRSVAAVRRPAVSPARVRTR